MAAEQLRTENADARKEIKRQNEEEEALIDEEMAEVDRAEYAAYQALERPTVEDELSQLDGIIDKLERQERVRERGIKRARAELHAERQATKRTKYTNPLRAHRVRIYPDKERQLKTLRTWFGAVRFCYNHLVERFRAVGRGGVSLKIMRDSLKQLEENNLWLRGVPYEVRDTAVRDFDKARVSHFAKVGRMERRGEAVPQNILESSFKFRSKKDRRQSFELRARDWGRSSGAFAQLFGKDKMKGAEELPQELEGSCRVVLDRLGRYYLCIPRQVAVRSEDQAPNPQCHGVVSLDPGVKTFQTTYDADGLVTEWGKDDMKKIMWMALKADKLQSEITRTRSTRRSNKRKALHRLFERMRHYVKEKHRKLAAWLCQNYRVILIPKFDTSKMVKRGQRKINSKTARAMCTWSHYAFRQLLKDTAELYPWVKIIECTEPYTSKTCGRCGTVHHRLGGARVFRCPSKVCGFKADRDVNGARNILIRWLTLYASTFFNK
jgi:putative transposase